ncbi:hypothetical protein [Streptomyces sp. NPDC058252]|uniref:hypothetical protein n=1 Tax=Streptomyces sp. NPDC058252 TaxID=3346405 RepID=UPI0036EFAAF3
MAYSNEVVEALATLRQAAKHSDEISNRLARAFDKLDNAGVFRELDEQTDYAPAEEILETDQHGNSTLPDGGHKEYVRSMETGA